MKLLKVRKSNFGFPVIGIDKVTQKKIRQSSQWTGAVRQLELLSKGNGNGSTECSRIILMARGELKRFQKGEVTACEQNPVWRLVIWRVVDLSFAGGDWLDVHLPSGGFSRFCGWLRRLQRGRMEWVGTMEKVPLVHRKGHSKGLMVGSVAEHGHFGFAENISLDTLGKIKAWLRSNNVRGENALNVVRGEKVESRAGGASGRLAYLFKSDYGYGVWLKNNGGFGQRPLLPVADRWSQVLADRLVLATNGVSDSSVLAVCRLARHSSEKPVGRDLLSVLGASSTGLIGGRLPQKMYITFSSTWLDDKRPHNSVRRKTRLSVLGVDLGRVLSDRVSVELQLDNMLPVYNWLGGKSPVPIGRSSLSAFCRWLVLFLLDVDLSEFGRMVEFDLSLRDDCLFASERHVIRKAVRPHTFHRGGIWDSIEEEKMQPIVLTKKQSADKLAAMFGFGGGEETVPLDPEQDLVWYTTH